MMRPFQVAAGVRVEIGIGQPSTGDAEFLAKWAQRAEELGFVSLGWSDRLVFGNYEPLISMAFAAAVTTKLKLTVGVLLSPLHTTAVLAKQVATLDHLSHGRLVLGVGLGGRGSDDHAGAGLSSRGRGRALNQQIEEMRHIWAGERRGMAGAIGPAPYSRPEGPFLLMGGRTEPAIQRTVKYADGWTAGGGGAEAYALTANAVSAAWKAAGKPGRPRLQASETFGLHAGAEEAMKAQIAAAFRQDPVQLERRTKTAIFNKDRLRAAIEAYAASGCEELILSPMAPDFDQMDLLAELAL